MNEKKQFFLPERNPVTHAAHRREVFWQITLPLLIGVLFIAAAVAGVIATSLTPTSKEIQRWMAISLIWLLLPLIPLMLLTLGVLIGLAYGMKSLLRLVPGYARIAQDYFVLFEYKLKRFTNRLIAPVIELNAWKAGLQRARQSVRKQVDEIFKPVNTGGVTKSSKLADGFRNSHLKD